MEDRPLPPSREDVREVTNDHIKLYLKYLPSDRLPILVTPFDINDVILEPEKLRKQFKD